MGTDPGGKLINDNFDSTILTRNRRTRRWRQTIPWASLFALFRDHIEFMATILHAMPL